MARRASEDTAGAGAVSGEGEQEKRRGRKGLIPVAFELAIPARLTVYGFAGALCWGSGVVVAGCRAGSWAYGGGCCSGAVLF